MLLVTDALDSRGLDTGRATGNSAPISLVGRIWVALSGLGAAVLGVLPHVLHHAGPLAGAAILGGAFGSILFGVLGLLASIPLLLRLRRRTGGWRVPAGLLALFATVFTLSTVVIGPAIAGDDDSGSATPPAPSAPAPSSHEEHH